MLLLHRTDVTPTSWLKKSKSIAVLNMFSVFNYSWVIIATRVNDIKAMIAMWRFKITGRIHSMAKNVTILRSTGEAKSIGIIAHDIRAWSKL